MSCCHIRSCIWFCELWSIETMSFQLCSSDLFCTLCSMLIRVAYLCKCFVYIPGFKRIFHSKMNHLSSFTRSHLIPISYCFLFSVKESDFQFCTGKWMISQIDGMLSWHKSEPGSQFISVPGLESGLRSQNKVMNMERFAFWMQNIGKRGFDSL